MSSNFPAVRLHGLLGKALQLSCNNRLKKIDYKQLVDPFRERNENDGAWRCEFWGKIVRSAILTNFYLQDPVLAEQIEDTVKDIISTQTPDGCISSYPTELQLSRWDIWGRKYVLLGLLRYYDFVKQDENVKNCCIKMLDHLMQQISSDEKIFTVYGEHTGLAASSILGAVVGVYRISEEKRFRDFALRIVNSGCSNKHDIFEAVLNGVPPSELGNGKAYEMTSCFQGLAELYMLEQNPEYKDICEKYFQSVKDKEIFITGTGGGRDRWGEFWDNGLIQQTAQNYAGGLGETCVTTTWIHYCERVADITLEASPFEEIERSLYNAVLGAMSPDGSRWMHINPTPLTGNGKKLAAGDQILISCGSAFGGHDCCRAQGPEALALASRLAVVKRKDSIDLNLFEPLDAEIDDGTKISISGNYPLEPTAQIKVYSTETLNLRVRISPFVKNVTLNGEKLDIVQGSYLSLNRKWQDNDVLNMEFDFSIREISSPDGAGYTAFMRGPLLLAEDSRKNVPDALLSLQYGAYNLVDYISAGNLMNETNTLKVWFK